MVEIRATLSERENKMISAKTLHQTTAVSASVFGVLPDLAPLATLPLFFIDDALLDVALVLLLLTLPSVL